MLKIDCPNCKGSSGVEFIDDKSQYITNTHGELYAVYQCNCGCYFKVVSSFKITELKHEVVYSEVWDV